MSHHYTTPAALSGLIAMLESVTPGEAAILAGLATSAVSQALALRKLSASQQEDAPPPYVPHPLDVLIFAAIEQDGAMQQAEMLAALASDTYKAGGSSRKVTGTALKNRLPDLVQFGAVVKTAAGYALSNRDAVKVADESFG